MNYLHLNHGSGLTGTDLLLKSADKDPHILKTSDWTGKHPIRSWMEEWIEKPEKPARLIHLLQFVQTALQSPTAVSDLSYGRCLACVWSLLHEKYYKNEYSKGF